MLAQLARWFRLDPLIEPAHQLYIALVAQARQPFFYEKLEVPDTLDGRFDMIALHACILNERFKAEDTPEHDALMQHVIEVLIHDMDRSLREMGVGDVGVGKKVKKMADALNGRLTTYAQALADNDDDALCAGLRRNLYGTVSEVDDASVKRVKTYITDAISSLQAQPIDEIAVAQLNWPEVK